MPRGGKRTGRVGVNYGNRTDLQLGARQPGLLPPSSDPSAPPIAPAPPAAGGSPPSSPLPGPPSGNSGNSGNPPGALAFDRPTELPDQPVTATPPVPQQPSPLLSAAAALNSLGHQASPQARALRAQLNATLANQVGP